jgi:hypothetical protein
MSADLPGTGVPPRDVSAQPTGRPAVPVSALRRWGPVAAGAAAIGAHLTIGVAYAASGLLAPGWAVALLGAWWLVLGGVLLLLVARRSLLTLAVPVVALLTWVLAISAGGAWLGWTA